jgi:hypothetical protein
MHYHTHPIPHPAFKCRWGWRGWQGDPWFSIVLLFSLWTLFLVYFIHSHIFNYLVSTVTPKIVLPIQTILLSLKLSVLLLNLVCIWISHLKLNIPKLNLRFLLPNLSIISFIPLEEGRTVRDKKHSYWTINFFPPIKCIHVLLINRRTLWYMAYPLPQVIKYTHMHTHSSQIPNKFLTSDSSKDWRMVYLVYFSWSTAWDITTVHSGVTTMSNHMDEEYIFLPL